MDDAERRRRLAALTAEQRAIFQLLCARKSRKEISELRDMTIAGVDYHCDQIAGKLGLREDAKRRNAVAFRLALLEFLPALLAPEAGDVPPAPEATEEPTPEDAPAPDPALLATIDAMAALARQPADRLAPWPEAAAGAPGRPGPTARQALGRWWRPLAFFLVVALAAGMAGGVTAAHMLASGPGTAPAVAALAAAGSPTPTDAPPSSVAESSRAAPTPTSAITATAVPTKATAVATAPRTAASIAPKATAIAPMRVAAATPTLAPDATPRDLAGQVASTRPGTPIALGRPVTSVIDRQAKPHDVYALALRAGQTLHVEVSAMTEAFDVLVAPPGAEDLIGEPGVPAGAILCNYRDPCRRDFPIATDGTYTLVVGTDDSGVRYTLQATAR